MIAKHAELSIRTRGKGTYEITEEVAKTVRESGVETGTVTIFIRHTSASLVIYENADSSARTDLHRYFEKIAQSLATTFILSKVPTIPRVICAWP